jgi:hypothetical protein
LAASLEQSFETIAVIIHMPEMLQLECEEDMPDMDYSYTRPILREEAHHLTFSGPSATINHNDHCYVDCRKIPTQPSIKTPYSSIHLLFSGKCNEKQLDMFEHNLFPQVFFAGKYWYIWQNWLTEYGWQRHLLDFRGSITQDKSVQKVLTMVTRVLRKHYKRQWLLLVYSFKTRLQDYGLLKMIHEYL